MNEFREKLEASEVNTSTTRRRILKGLAAGAGVAVWHGSLPSKWVSPIIQGIALPAHAQTSGPIESATMTTAPTTTTTTAPTITTTTAPPTVRTVRVGNLLGSRGTMTIIYTSLSGPQTETLGNNRGGAYDCIEGSQITITVAGSSSRDIIAGSAGCASAGSVSVTFTVDAALVATTCSYGYHIFCNS